MSAHGSSRPPTPYPALVVHALDLPGPAGRRCAATLVALVGDHALGSVAAQLRLERGEELRTRGRILAGLVRIAAHHIATRLRPLFLSPLARGVFDRDLLDLELHRVGALWQHLDYDRLDSGITATIHGIANRGTVNKGAADADTIVDGAWDGRAFSYTFSNIERVRGGSGIDIIGDSPGDDRLSGGGDGDLFALEYGGNDRIDDFSEEDDDMIWFVDLAADHGLTHADVIAAARQDGGDVVIDLSSYGRGTVRIKSFSIDSLSVGDITL